jgi:hypothetical protein
MTGSLFFLLLFFLVAARFIGPQGQDDPASFAPAFAQAFECDKFMGVAIGE